MKMNCCKPLQSNITLALKTEDSKWNKKQKEKVPSSAFLNFFSPTWEESIEGEELRQASGNVSEWARRVRELRDEDGYQILTHRDRADLKPGEYLLETVKRVPAFSRSISKETRAYVLERNGYTCQMCGLAAGDPDPYDSSRTLRLTIGHIIDKSKGGLDVPNNLRAVCTNCNEGLQNIAPRSQIVYTSLGKFGVQLSMINYICWSGWNGNLGGQGLSDIPL